MLLFIISTYQRNLEGPIDPIGEVLIHIFADIQTNA